MAARCTIKGSASASPVRSPSSAEQHDRLSVAGPPARCVRRSEWGGSPTGNRCSTTTKEQGMAEAIQVSGPISGTDKTLSYETGKLAQQSQGAVVAGIGRTTVLATANAAKDVREGIDFFPLTVDVE